MRRSPVALVPAAVGLLLAACVGDRDTTAPRSAPSGSPSFTAAATTTPACDITIMKDALAYFATGDAVFTDIPLMANAYSVAPHTNPAAATPFGLNILSHIAAARRVSSRLKPGTTPAAGATLAHDVAECMNLGSLDLTFATTAIGSGIFEVRGGDGDSQSAALAYPEHFPRWGVESETATWPTTPTVRVPRYLILGTPGAPVATLGGEPQAVASFVGGDLARLPADLAVDGLRVGICIKTTTSDLNAVNRLIHAGVVEENSPPTVAFCTGAPSAPVGSLSRSTWFASLTNRVTSVFSPALLLAQEDGGGRDLESFTGGGPSGWSPQAFVKIVGTSVGTSFKVQPKNGSDAPAKLPTFVVHAATPSHSLKGLAVTMIVANNQGAPAGAFLTGTTTVLTNDNGDATFSNVMVNKPGSYILTAIGKIGGVPTLQVNSSKFIVKNH